MSKTLKLQHTKPVKTAVILAAGMGIRLSSHSEDLPKGLLEFGGESLLSRSIRILRAYGIERTIIAVGYKGEKIQQKFPELEYVHNPAYDETGSMATLDCVLSQLNEDFLLLESDIIYESRAIEFALTSKAPNLVLASSPTNAGDEVWIDEQEGLVVKLSKNLLNIKTQINEFVGINRFSVECAKALQIAYTQLVEQYDHKNISYETDALVKIASYIPIHLVRINDLIWGELDTLEHSRRIHDIIIPRLKEIEPPAFRPND